MTTTIKKDASMKLIHALCALSLAFSLNAIAEINLTADETSKDAIQNRIQPAGEVNVAPATNTPASATPSPAPVPTTAATATPVSANSGELTYNKYSVACHAAGIAGAPKKGD